MIPAVVLAGGLGTRLAAVSEGLPKPMLEVAGRPFLEYVLDTLIDAGVSQIVLAVSYRWNILRRHFGDSYRGASVEYSVEEQPLGTGGAIRQCLNDHQLAQALILNGDTLFRIDLADLVARHKQSAAKVTMALRRVDNASRYGLVTCDNSGIVTAFRSDGDGKPGLINGGTYVVNTLHLDGVELPPGFSFERDFLERYVSRIRPLGVESSGYFVDIGIPEDLARARIDFAN
jgi:D-glycero-alpha-D-manno-heptose 1-phosphate guanylyltransferase